MTDDAYTRALAEYRLYRYGALDDAGQTIECCALTALAIEGAIPWARDWDWWGDMMVLDPARPWSAIEATATRLGVEPVMHGEGPHRPRLGGWSLVQLWRPSGSGHQVLWRTHDTVPWLGWSWESSSRGGVGTAVRGLLGLVGMSRVTDSTGAVVSLPPAMDFGGLYDADGIRVAWVDLPDRP